MSRVVSPAARAVSGVLVASSALVACSALVGTRDLTFVADDAGVSSDSGGAPGDDAGTPAACNADLTRDPLHCGQCGHSCLGGQCVNATCQPFPLVSGQGGPTALTLDATNLYWVTEGQEQIVKAAKDGTGVTVLSKAPLASSPAAIAVDDTTVYWASFSPSTATPRIVRCAKSGCGGAGTPVVSNLQGPVGVAVDATNVYWVENYDPYAIGRASKTDGSGSGTMAEAGNFAHGIAIDDTSVYFAVEGFIGKIAKNAPVSAHGSTYQKLFAVDPMYAYGITVDATRVYWAVNDGPGEIFAMSKNGGNPTAIATGLSFPYALAIDDTNVYWVNVGPNAGTDNDPIFTDGTVMTCPKTGCPASGPTTLASKQAWLQLIAVDGDAVYWASKGNSSLDGAIMKIAK